MKALRILTVVLCCDVIGPAVFGLARAQESDDNPKPAQDTVNKVLRERVIELRAEVDVLEVERDHAKVKLSDAFTEADGPQDTDGKIASETETEMLKFRMAMQHLRGMADADANKEYEQGLDTLDLGSELSSEEREQARADLKALLNYERTSNEALKRLVGLEVRVRRSKGDSTLERRKVAFIEVSKRLHAAKLDLSDAERQLNEAR